MNIYVIILNGSPRVDALRLELSRVGLEHAQFVLRDRDPEDGIRGCFHSHVACLNMIAESNQMGLILEDDVRFTMPQQVAHMLQAASEYVGRNPDAIVTLGGIACGILRPVANAPYILRGPWLLTHAYIVSPVAARGLATSQFAGQHYDKFLANSRYELCMTSECVAFQADNISDTTTGRTWWYQTTTKLRNLVTTQRLQTWSVMFFSLPSRFCCRAF